MRTTKRFYVTETVRSYDGRVWQAPRCYKRFDTMAEAERFAKALSAEHGLAAQDALYLEWLADPAEEWATEAWLKGKRAAGAYYRTYEAKASDVA